MLEQSQSSALNKIQQKERVPGIDIGLDRDHDDDESLTEAKNSS